MIDAHEELPIRSQTVKLPRTKEKTLDLLKDLLDLSAIQEISITSADITVSRQVAETQPVIPSRKVEETIDGEAVLHRISDDVDSYPYHPDDHPLFVMRDVMDSISRRGLRPNWVLAPADGWLEAYFGLPDVPPATHVFGMRVIHFKDRDYRKLVVVGSPTDYISDALHGVIVDMGA